MKALLRPAISLFLLLSVVTGLVYPLVVTGIARWLFPEAAAGSLIVRDGKPVGSALIGQNFTDPKYFWGRPSATAPLSQQRRRLQRLQPGAAEPGAGRCGQGTHRGPQGGRSRQQPADPGSIWSPPPPAVSIRTSARLRPHTRSSGSPGRASSSRPASGAGRPAHRRSPVGRLRRTAGQCARAQSGARRSASVSGADGSARNFGIVTPALLDACRGGSLCCLCASGIRGRR